MRIELRALPMPPAGDQMSKHLSQWAAFQTTILDPGLRAVWKRWAGQPHIQLLHLHHSSPLPITEQRPLSQKLLFLWGKVAVCPKSQHLGNRVMSSTRWRTAWTTLWIPVSNNKRAVVFKSLIRFSFLMFQWGGQIQGLLFCAVSMHVCLSVAVCLSISVYMSLVCKTWYIFEISCYFNTSPIYFP